jgi:hypothetical protein
VASVVIRLISREVGESFKPPLPLDRAVAPGEDLAKVFKDIADTLSKARNRIERLVLYCHAYSSGGEFTVFLGNVGGRPGFRAADVPKLFAPLKGRFANTGRGIEIQACNVASNQGADPSKVPTVGSGAALCQAIANAAGTGVLAADRDQPGTCFKTEIVEVRRNERGLPQEYVTPGPVVDCQADVWSGQVWLFSPKGGGATQFTPP